MPIVPCPNCRESVEIEPNWYGRRVVCPSCEQRFLAERPTDDRDDNDPRRRDDDDDRPRRRRSRDDDRPKSGGKGLLIVLGVVGGLLLLVCGGCVGFIVYVNKAKVTFDGPWSDQSVGPDTGVAVTASFPKPGISEPLFDLAGGGNGSMIAYSNMDQDDSVKDAAFAIGYVDYPAGTANPLDKGYLALREQISERFVANPLMKPVIKKESSTTVNGYPAKEVEYAEDDGSFTLRVIHVNDRPKSAAPRLGVVLAGGTAMKDADKQKFLQSVKIGKGK